MKIRGFILSSLALAGCASGPAPSVENYGAQVGVVNHTDRYIYATTVGSSSGGHANAFSAGVANICCVELPEAWRPGLKFTVRWDMPLSGRHIYKEALVEVEKYDEPGSLYLHFFPDDKVRIVVTPWYGGAREHPIAPPVKPSSRKDDELPK